MTDNSQNTYSFDEFVVIHFVSVKINGKGVFFVRALH